MQLLFAYAFDRPTDRGRAREGLKRVQAHYRRLWPEDVRHDGMDVGRVGIHMWDGLTPRRQWPSWHKAPDVAVATLYVPLGYEDVSGNVPAASAAPLLAKAFRDRPWSILKITSPFVLGSLFRSSGELRLHTDSFGLGRLFELRFDGGWAWSNRPAALCLFAGMRAERDRDGWRTFAATGWFTGDRSPFAKVFAVPAGTTIHCPPGSGLHRTRFDSLAACLEGRDDPLTPSRLDETAEALQGAFTSLYRIWPGTVVADLSGGRDSRLVVAAALAAGLELEIRTNGAQPGEADVAERLIAALPASIVRRVRHFVHRPPEYTTADPRRTTPVLSNVLAWHRCQEGLRPSTYMPSRAPTGLFAAESVTVGGAAGELAHGHYYPNDYAAIARLPTAERFDAFAVRLAGAVVRKPGISVAAQATALADLRRVLEKAFLRGIQDANALDYYYAAERLRRWGTAAERTGTLTPLLTVPFVRASFDLSPEQRRDNALHRALTERLVPEWKDQPYYRRPSHLVLPSLAPRIGRSPDRNIVSAIISDSAVWKDAFDPAGVAESWKRMRGDRGTPDDERLLQRVCWHVVFSDFLCELNGQSTPPSPPATERRLSRRSEHARL
jgi:hypothetical protein